KTPVAPRVPGQDTGGTRRVGRFAAQQPARGQAQRGVAQQVVDRPEPRAVVALAAEDGAVDRAGVARAAARVEGELDRVLGAEEVVIVAGLTLRMGGEIVVVGGRALVERPAGGSERGIVELAPKRAPPLRRR